MKAILVLISIQMGFGSLFAADLPIERIKVTGQRPLRGNFGSFMLMYGLKQMNYQADGGGGGGVIDHGAVATRNTARDKAYRMCMGSGMSGADVVAVATAECNLGYGSGYALSCQQGVSAGVQKAKAEGKCK